MAYTAWSVVYGEQPTAAKWNQLGTNDAGFKDGTNIDAGAITPSKRSGGFKIGTIAAATLGSTGNKAISGLGFQPKLVRFAMLQTISSGTNSIYGLGAMTSANQYTHCATIDATNRSRYSSKSACISGVGSGSATPFILANYVSMDADGFTINVSTASNAFDWAYEAFA